VRYYEYSSAGCSCAHKSFMKVMDAANDAMLSLPITDQYHHLADCISHILHCVQDFLYGIDCGCDDPDTFRVQVLLQCGCHERRRSHVH